MKKLAVFSSAILVFSTSILGQNVTHDSYAKARPVLDRAVAALGGLSTLRSIENVTYRIEGDTVHRNQSHKPFAFDRTPYKGSFIIDVKNTRYRQEQEGHYPGGFDWTNGFAIHKTEGVSWDVLRGTASVIPNVAAANFRGRTRFFPHFILLNAVDRASRLRYLGKEKFDGRPHSVISYANEDGLEISLYIDDKSSLLSKFETLGTDQFTGDTVTELVFTGYQKQGTHSVPTGRLDRRGGELLNDFKLLDIVVNASLTDESFKLPTGMRILAPGPAQPLLAKYSDNVYTINVGYNVLTVGFKDHVFVMEAPNNDGVSKQVIAEVKKLFPGKPIRYIAVTHHHDDHAGGIRTYVAEGATLLGLPGEKAFFEKVVKSVFTIDPDSLTLNPQPLKWESITGGKRVLTDGTTNVELIDIGPGGHTDEMLVAYLPSEKLVFQGDLVNRPANNDPATINSTTVHFANWLEKARLPVTSIIGVHGPPSTIDELRQGVAAKVKGGN